MTLPVILKHLTPSQSPSCEDDQELNTALVTGTDEWFDALDHTASEFISVTPVAT